MYYSYIRNPIFKKSLNLTGGAAASAQLSLEQRVRNIEIFLSTRGYTQAAAAASFEPAAAVASADDAYNNMTGNLIKEIAKLASITPLEVQEEMWLRFIPLLQDKVYDNDQYTVSNSYYFGGSRANDIDPGLYIRIQKLSDDYPMKQMKINIPLHPTGVGQVAKKLRNLFAA